jgi:hypothetical protein
MNEPNRMLRISEKLRAAKLKGVRPFGTEAHFFKMEPVLKDQEVAEFERQWHVQLPPEYRAFIKYVGNGGAGPAYGMLQLHDAIRFQRPNIPHDFLCTPFPFTTPYNPCDDPKLSSFCSKDSTAQITAEEEYDARKMKETTGTLVLCHEGCGYYHLLVVSGQERGQMWLDGTCSDGGYMPLGVGFIEWYEKWLDSALAGGRGVWWMSVE